MRKNILITFLLIFLFYGMGVASEIYMKNIELHNGRLVLNIFSDKNDFAYTDIYDKSVKKYIVKILNAHIKKEYYKKINSLNIYSVKLAQNNPVDVWLVVSVKTILKNKKITVNRLKKGYMLKITLFVPKLKKKKSKKAVAVSSKTKKREKRTLVNYDAYSAKEGDMQNIIFFYKEKKDEKVYIDIKKNKLVIKDPKLLSFLKTGKTKAAVKVLYDYSEKYPKYAPYFYEKMAELYYNEGDYVNAFKFYKKAYRFYKKKNNKGRAAYYTGLLNYLAGRNDDALTFLNISVKLTNNSYILYNAYFLTGEVYETEKKYANAIDSYKRALNLARNKKDMADTLSKIYKIYYDKDDYDNCVVYIMKLKNIYNVYPYFKRQEIDYDLADIYYKSGKREKAAVQYLAIIKNYKDLNSNDWAYYQLANIYLQSGNKEKAKNYFTALIKKYPDSYWVEHAKLYLSRIMEKKNG